MLKAKFSVFVLIAVMLSCKTPIPMDILQENLIPQPVSVEATQSSFEITAKTTICVPEGSKELLKTGQILAGVINPSTGLNLQVKEVSKAPRSKAIYLNVDESKTDLGKEGYELIITDKLVTITAAQAAGAFYGVQTLRQLLPAKIEKQEVQEGPWLIASGTVTDKPEYEYRGAMLDVARHFFGVDDVKRFIDYLAYYKINFLHLHLSDDQGWRVEIKSWPNLTIHGGSTEVGGGEGGFYTQEQFKELVKYADERFVTIVPEIDMPGHTNAALASYPELNCNGKATELYTGMKVGFSTLCTDKEITYKFVDDVVREISEMITGQYFHIGGDESHVTPLKDYIPFIERAQEIVHKHGKTVIGWDEIAHAKLAESSVVQFWAKEENAKKGIDQGCKVLMSPAKRTYLDMKYDSTSTLGLNWAAYIEVDEAYDWHPETYAEGIKRENILGIESPLWSETVETLDDIEWLVFPRLAGHAEIGWSPASVRNWENYKLRLAAHGERMEAMDINFYKSELVPWGDKE